MKRLTEKQLTFVRHASRGVRPMHAAELAGYAFPSVDGCRLMQIPAVADALRKERDRFIQGEIAPRALQCLMLALDDPNLSPKDRFPYVKLALQAAGHLSKGGDDEAAKGGASGKRLEDMSYDELMAEAAKTRQAIAEREASLRTISTDSDRIAPPVIDATAEEANENNDLDC